MASLTRFDNRDIVNDIAKVTTSTWTSNTNELTTVHTSSTQAVLGAPTSSGAHFIDVYDVASSTTGAEVQYSIAYGHKSGGGSEDFTNAAGALGISPSRNIYSQYRQLVYGSETTNFKFTDYTPDDIYVININRARYKHSLKPGSLNLTIGTLHLTDDSVTLTGSSTVTNAGRQFNIVSGSSGTRLGSNTVHVTDSGSYGFFYPDSGFIVLNPATLDATVADGGLALATSVLTHTQADNHQKLANKINTGNSFIVDSEEKISSTYYFARARNHEYNYTTNPSFTDDSGNVLINSMIDNPTVYITTVGMYNDAGDLLAIAKLSQPVTKDFTKESLIRVKLDY
tara:strand:- start:1770 stop:2792 length:1023 start_codon:yes stop_codon:yes gene_type:complete